MIRWNSDWSTIIAKSPGLDPRPLLSLFFIGVMRTSIFFFCRPSILRHDTGNFWAKIGQTFSAPLCYPPWRKKKEENERVGTWKADGKPEVLPVLRVRRPDTRFYFLMMIRTHLYWYEYCAPLKLTVLFGRIISERVNRRRQERPAN